MSLRKIAALLEHFGLEKRSRVRSEGAPVGGKNTFVVCTRTDGGFKGRS